MKKILSLFALILSVGTALQADDLCVLRREFIKFGKKEAYESTCKDLMEGWAKFSAKKGVGTLSCFQGTDSSQYFYFYGVKDFKGLERRMKAQEDYIQGLPKEKLAPFQSMLNFITTQLQEARPSCSYIPKDRQSWDMLPQAHFYFWSLIPGAEQAFEAKLSELASEQAQSDHPVYFRCWRILLGGDMPQYVVGVFAITEKELNSAASSFAQSVTSVLSGELRSQKDVGAVFRVDLSLR